MKNNFFFATIRKATSSSKWSITQDAEQHVAFSHGARIQIQSRFSYPQTFIFETTDLICTGYADTRTIEYIRSCSRLEDIVNYLDGLIRDEYCIVIVCKDTREIHCIRDLYCTLPLYYGFLNDDFVISSEFSVFITRQQQTSSISINLSYLCEQLLHQPESVRTPLSGVYFLSVKQQLVFSTSVDVRNRFDESLLKSHIDRDSTSESLYKRYKSAVEDALSYHTTKLNEYNMVATELSCGLDSTLVTSYLANNTNGPLDSITYIPPTAQSQTLGVQIDSMKKTYNLSTHKVHILSQDKYPLGGYLTGKKLLLNPFLESYRELIEDESRILAHNSVNTVFTGTGGDELFITSEVIATHVDKVALSLEIPPFYTPYLAKNILATIRSKHKKKSVIYEQLALANLQRSDLTANNIWPIDPLMDPELYKATSSLPLDMVQDKKIMRDYLKQTGVPQLIYKAPRDTSFNDFCSYAKKYTLASLIESLFTDSRLSALDIVDDTKLIQYHDSLSVDDAPQLILLHHIIVMELFIRSIESLGYSVTMSSD